MDIGGATLAAAAMRAGLIERVRLVKTRTFPEGVVLTRYETTR